GSLAAPWQGGQQPGNGQTCCSSRCQGDPTGATACSTDADCTAALVAPPCVPIGHCLAAPATTCTTNTDCAVGDMCVPCNCPCGANQPCCDGAHVGPIAVPLSPLTTGPARPPPP